MAIGARREEFGSEDVALSAEDINKKFDLSIKELDDVSKNCESDPSEDNMKALMRGIQELHWWIVGTEFRLLQTRIGKEKMDYINFGLENRLAAQNELMKNLRTANHALHEVMEKAASNLTDNYFSNLQQFLKNNTANSDEYFKKLEQNLGKVLRHGEITRVLLGATIGGTFAGLTSMSMGYIEKWFGPKGINASQTPTFENDDLVTLLHDNELLRIMPNSAGDLDVWNSSGNGIIIDVPADIDIRNVVVNNDLRMFDATTGRPVGQLNLETVTQTAAETVGFKEPQSGLFTTLSPERHTPISIGDKQFALVLDNDGNMTLHPTLADSTADLDNPLQHTPINVFSDEVRQHIDALRSDDPNLAQEFINKAAQFNVDIRDNGAVIVKSVYNGSVVADFKLDTSGTVAAVAGEPGEHITAGAEAAAAVPDVEVDAEAPESAAPTAAATPVETALPAPTTPPATPTQFTEQLFADDNNPVTKLLKTMGVEKADVVVNDDGSFSIPDNAVSGEYLGETAGWRQRRLEMLLEAYNENRISTGESEQVILARLERAARHVMLEHDKYPSPKAALDEAFGRDAAFIQRAEVPYISGKAAGHAGVDPMWAELVNKVRNLQSQPTPVGGVAEAVTPSGAGAPTGVSSVGPEAAESKQAVGQRSVSPRTGEAAAAKAASPRGADAGASLPVEAASIHKPLELNDLFETLQVEIKRNVGEYVPDTGVEGYEEDLLAIVRDTAKVVPAAVLMGLTETYARALTGKGHLLSRKVAPYFEYGTKVKAHEYPRTPEEEAATVIIDRSRTGGETAEPQSPEAQQILDRLSDLENHDYWRQLEEKISQLRVDWDAGNFDEAVAGRESEADSIINNLNDIRYSLYLDISSLSGEHKFFDKTDELRVRLNSFNDEFSTRILTRDQSLQSQIITAVDPKLELTPNRFDNLPPDERRNGINTAISEFNKYNETLHLLRDNILLRSTNTLDNNKLRQSLYEENRRVINAINKQLRELKVKRDAFPAAGGSVDEVPLPATGQTTLPAQEITKPIPKQTPPAVGEPTGGAPAVPAEEPEITASSSPQLPIMPEPEAAPPAAEPSQPAPAEPAPAEPAALPQEEPTNPGGPRHDAAARLAESAASIRRFETLQNVETKLNKADPVVAGRWIHSYENELDWLVAFTDEIETANLLNLTMLRRLSNYLNRITGAGAAQLKTAGMLNDNGTVNRDRIRAILTKFKTNPNSAENPFEQTPI